MAATTIPRATLKPLGAKLDQMVKQALRAKKKATAKDAKRLLGVRIKKLRRAKKAIMAICRAFNI
jgi:hypothetical protein